MIGSYCVWDGGICENSVKKEDIIVTLILLLTPLCSCECAGLVATVCIQCVFVCILLPSSLTSENNLLFHITK